MATEDEVWEGKGALRQGIILLDRKGSDVLLKFDVQSSCAFGEPWCEGIDC